MKHVRGGFAMGMIVGLLIGLALALGVALYVTKVPVPFVNKVPQRTAEQEAAEAERNKNWDPNAGLNGRGASAPIAGGVGGSASGTAPRPTTATTPRPGRDPAAILSGQDPGTPSASTKPGADPFVYFVQAGAFGREEEAEQQRAKLAMLGYKANITEREQAGRPVFRVRLGPYEKKDDADAALARLQASGTETALVRTYR